MRTLILKTTFVWFSCFHIHFISKIDFSSSIIFVYKLIFLKIVVSEVIFFFLMNSFLDTLSFFTVNTLFSVFGTVIFFHIFHVFLHLCYSSEWLETLCQIAFLSLSPPLTQTPLYSAVLFDVTDVPFSVLRVSTVSRSLSWGKRN